MSFTDLLELEYRGWNSLCTGDGVNLYGRVMLPDGLCSHEDEWRIALYQQTPAPADSPTNLTTAPELQ